MFIVFLFTFSFFVLLLPKKKDIHADMSHSKQNVNKNGKL